MLELKYAAKRFGDMDENERFSFAEVLLLRISVITGWTLPLSELMNVLIDQFQKILSEKYRNVNIEEFEYAFRQKGIEVKDWGKAMNLSLIDEVMLPYLESRAELSRMEEQKKSAPQIEEKKELSDEEWEEWIVDIRGYNLDKIPVPCYHYLLRKGRINPTNEEKKEYIDKAMPIYSVSIQDDLRKWSDFLKQKSEGVITGNHLASLITISKRLIVQEYFKNNP